MCMAPPGQTPGAWPAAATGGAQGWAWIPGQMPAQPGSKSERAAGPSGRAERRRSSTYTWYTVHLWTCTHTHRQPCVSHCASAAPCSAASVVKAQAPRARLTVATNRCPSMQMVIFAGSLLGTMSVTRVSPSRWLGSDPPPLLVWLPTVTPASAPRHAHMHPEMSPEVLPQGR